VSRALYLTLTARRAAGTREGSGRWTPGVVSVFVSVVVVREHSPVHISQRFTLRQPQWDDHRRPRTELESGLGASPRGFESRILRRQLGEMLIRFRST
jgi:hypothetical protein